MTIDSNTRLPLTVDIPAWVLESVIEYNRKHLEKQINVSEVCTDALIRATTKYEPHHSDQIEDHLPESFKTLARFVEVLK